MAENPTNPQNQQKPIPAGVWIRFTESVRLYGESDGHIIARAGDKVLIKTEALVKEVFDNNWGHKFEEVVTGKFEKVVNAAEAAFIREKMDLLKRRDALMMKMESNQEAMDEEALAILNDQASKLDKKRKEALEDNK